MIIRKIQKEDNRQIARIIREVMTEFGASGEGFSIHDAEVDNMHEAYNAPGAAYFVVENDGKVVGGAGIASLEGGPEEMCELKKMYFLPEARGKGMGKKLVKECLAAATSFGYKTVYIETVSRMEAANKLYASSGFEKIAYPLGATGHHGCESFYILNVSLDKKES